MKRHLVDLSIGIGGAVLLLLIIAATLDNGTVLAQGGPRSISGTQFFTRPGSFTSNIQTKRQFVPATATVLIYQDVYPETLTLTNISSSTVTITLWDRQTTPTVVFQSTIAGAASGSSNNYTVPLGTAWCPGGLVWQADTGSAVYGWISAKY